MGNNVAVIIRSAHERTETLCFNILKRQVPESHIVVIHERPFSRALKRGFEIALDLNLDWTLCVDADVLITTDGVSRLINAAEAGATTILGGHGWLLDKLMGYKRHGPPHLYRTAVLADAIDLVPNEQITVRPETFVHNAMQSKGFDWVPFDVLVSLHHYEQSYRDIFRSMLVRAVKSPKQLPQMLNRASRYARYDRDFQVAHAALKQGMKVPVEQITLDATQWDELFAQFMQMHQLQEKLPLNAEDLTMLHLADHIVHSYEAAKDSYLQDVIMAQQTPHTISPIYWYLNHYNQKLKRRIQRVLW